MDEIKEKTLFYEDNDSVNFSFLIHYIKEHEVNVWDLFNGTYKEAKEHVRSQIANGVIQTGSIHEFPQILCLLDEKGITTGLPLTFKPY